VVSAAHAVPLAPTLHAFLHASCAGLDRIIGFIEAKGGLGPPAIHARGAGHGSLTLLVNERRHWHFGRRAHGFTQKLPPTVGTKSICCNCHF
jgi:hypothetical protein